MDHVVWTYEEGMHMKTIKVRFIGQPNGVSESSYLYKILKENFKVEISDTPDFIISGITPSGRPCEYASYDCVRLCETFGENACPDFAAFDYAIGFDDIVYGDRFFRYLLFMNYFRKFSDEELLNFSNQLFWENKQVENSNREFFCDFIYSHPSSNSIRDDFFDKFSKYKHVESVGTYRNNNGGKNVKNYTEKKKFQERCKFSIACENVSLRGYTTEKIIHPFLSGSIPVYYGNPEVSQIFNEKAFVNCHNFASIDEVLEYVKYIDTHDDVYWEMLRQPIFVDPQLPYKMITGLRQYIIDVFSQNVEEAYRRPRFFLGNVHSECLKAYDDFTQSKFYWAFLKYKHLLKIKDRDKMQSL